MQRKSFRFFLGGLAVGVPVVTWFVRKKKRDNKQHRKDEFGREAAEDFTAEQTALLTRVREICETVGDQALDLQHSPY
jgi:hypothetical protein